MREPDFWQDKNSIKSKMLLPLSLIYSLLFFLNQKFTSAYRSKSIVISVGNIVVGGSGKTPIVCTIAEFFRSHNLKVVIASRGYRGSNKIIKKVSKNDDAKIVGDEPLILCNFATCYVGKNKKKLLQYIDEKENPDLIILDDGLQNPAIVKDYRFLVINGRKAFGNEKIFPAGPLREKIDSGLRNADNILLTSETETKDDLLSSLPKSKLVKTKMMIIDSNLDKNAKYIGFVGIADPERFMNSLKQAELNIVKKFIYDDHYYYSEKDLKYLYGEAEKIKANLITTEKDYVRIPLEFRDKVKILKISLELENTDFLKKIVEKVKKTNIA